LVRRHHRVLRLLWTLGLGIRWQHANGNIAIAFWIRGCSHVSRQELTRETTEGRNQLEGGLSSFWIGSHHVVRRLVQVFLVGAGWVCRDRPEGIVVKEHVWIINVVARQDGTLHLEHILRVAEVRTQLIRDFRLRLYNTWEDTLPSLQHWIFWIELIDFHRAVVGINSCLDGVADIAHFVRNEALLGTLRIQGIGRSFREVFTLCVREAIQGGVAIHDPLDSTVDHSWLGLRISGQPWSYLFYTLGWIAIVENARFRTDALLQQQVHFLVTQCIGNAVKHIANVHAALTVIGK